MKKLQRGVILMLVVALTVLPLSMAYAGGYNLAGIGAKALAMSGSFRAIADDYTAAYWNPAGIAGQSNMVSFEAKFLAPMVWVTPNVPQTSYYTGYVNGVEQTAREDYHPAGSFGLTYQINDKFTACLAAYAPTAIAVDFDGLYSNPYPGYNTRTDVEKFPTNSWYSSLKVYDIHPTVGYKVSENVSVGMGIAIQYTDIVLRSPSLAPSGAPIPYDHLFIVGELSGTGMGFGMNFGVKIDMAEKFHVGMAYRTPTKLKITDGELKQDLYTPYSVYLYNRLAQANDPKAALFSGEKLSASPKAEATLEIPMDFGIDLAYDFSDNFTGAVGLTWTNWTNINKVEIKVDGTDPTGAEAEDTELALFYKDTIRFNFGGDYKPMEKLNVYFGYYYDPSAIPDKSLRPSITDVATKHNASIGFGYAINENLMVQGYWEHLWSPEREIEPEDATGNGVADNVAGTWKMQVDTFGITFGYRF